MGASSIGSRGVMAMMRRELDIDPGIDWVEALSGVVIPSTSAIEEYPFISNVPAMREWIGGRQEHEFHEYNIKVTNSHFEATIPVKLSELRRDKTGMLRMRISDLARRGSTHWARHLSDLILAGEAAPSYDGAYYYDTNHVLGDTPAQSNKIDVDISALPAAVHGSVTAPSPAEAQQAMLRGISAITGFKDEHLEPRNESAREFTVMTGSGLAPAVRAGLTKDVNTAESTFDFGGMRVTQRTNVRLDASVSKIYIFRTDGMTKPIFRQQEGDQIAIKAKAEGSDYEFDNDAHSYGLDAWRKAFYAYWDHAVLVNLV